MRARLCQEPASRLNQAAGKSAWRANVAGLLLLPVTLVAVAQTDAAALTGNGEAGRMHFAGRYPVPKSGVTPVALAGDRILLYGTNSLILAGNLAKRLDKLRQSRGSTSMGPYFQGPLVWRGQAEGWQKLDMPPQCPHPHNLATATALADGTVLIAGGICDEARMADDLRPQEPYRSVSLWNGATDKWLEATAALEQARIHHTATLLPDGSVLIVGGQGAPESRDGSPPPGGEAVLASVERYAAGKIENAAPLATARAGHTATLLRDGRLLVAGGYDAQLAPLGSAELYDAAARRWLNLPPLRLARYGHTATLLDDGRVLVTGGQNDAGEPVAATEIWNPNSGRWEPGAPILVPLVLHSAVRLATGDVLVAGGLTVEFEPVRKAMLWNHQTGQWQPAGFRDATLWAQAGSPTLAMLPGADGSALAFGDSRILQWRPQAPAATPYAPYGRRTAHSATLLADGRVLLAGGRNGDAFHDWTEVFDPETRQFSIAGRLHQPRANHAATRLDDGRVVVAGGWVRAPESPSEPLDNSPEVWNPATGGWTLLGDVRFAWQDWVHLRQLADGRVLFFASRELAKDVPDRPVEYRAWLWEPRSNAVSALTVPLVPRAGAGIAVLPDGRVLAVGGQMRRLIDGELETGTYPDAEIWDIATASVRTISAPPAWHAENPRTLVLRNGNVLLTNLQAIDPRHADRKTAAVHVLDARTMQWRRLPDIPEHLSWPLMELSDGTLVTRAAEDGVLAPQQHRLAPEGSEWQRYPGPPQDRFRLLQVASGPLLSLATEAPFSAEFDEIGRSWLLPATGMLAPRWREPPAAAALADGSLAVVGLVKSGPEAVSSAYRWHPRDGQWLWLGDLSRRYRNGALLQLRSGRIVHIGITGPNQLVCEARPSEAEDWQACGAFTFSGALRFALATLEDGRGALMVGTDKLYIFDEAGAVWKLARLESSEAPLKSFGAPVQRGEPLARAFEDGNPDPIDATLIAAKHWESSASGTAPRFLWDPEKGHWAYIFLSSQKGMGKGAAFLPDGCALSGPPYRLFNPRTGKVTELVEHFGDADWLQGTATVLADGTVAVVGVSSSDEAEKFARRKASCAGIDSGTGGFGLVTPARRDAAAAESVLAVSKAGPFWILQFGAVEIDLRWVALAIIAPLLAYLLLRRFVVPPLRALLVRANDSPAGRITIPLPRDTGRVIFYTLAAVIIVPMALNLIGFQRARQEEYEWASGSNAVDPSTGILKAVPTPGESGNARPAIECRFVGTWISRHGAKLHRFRLTSDGRYAGGVNIHGTEPSDTYTGFWSIQGRYMVWRNDGAGEPDVNEIIDEREERFTLIEGNGDRTVFELVERGDPGNCAPGRP